MKISSDMKAIMFLIISTLILFGFILTTEKQKKFEYPLITEETEFDLILPSYIPDGFSIIEYDISPISFSVSYSSGEKTLDYLQINSISNSVSLDNENNMITEYKSDRFEGYLLTDKYIKPLHLICVWDKENCFAINGNVEKEDIIKILESLEVYYPMK